MKNKAPQEAEVDNFLEILPECAGFPSGLFPAGYREAGGCFSALYFLFHVRFVASDSVWNA